MICVICDGLKSIDKRAELKCLVNLHNPHIMFFFMTNALQKMAPYPD